MLKLKKKRPTKKEKKITRVVVLLLTNELSDPLRAFLEVNH